jgi:DNA-binding LacI/PurR family transcriptional regulator
VAYVGERLVEPSAGINVYGKFNEYYDYVLEMFYARGHRDIFVLAFESDRKTEINFRYFDIYKSFCARHGLRFSPGNILNVTDVADLSDLMAKKIFANASGHPAIYTIASSEYAYWILDGIRSLDLLVPQDVSVVCNQYFRVSDRPDSPGPPFSAIYIPAFEMGSRMAELLLEKLSQRNPLSREVSVDFEYIDRGSVARVG